MPTGWEHTHLSKWWWLTASLLLWAHSRLLWIAAWTRTGNLKSTGKLWELLVQWCSPVGKESLGLFENPQWICVKGGAWILKKVEEHILPATSLILQVRKLRPREGKWFFLKLICISHRPEATVSWLPTLVMPQYTMTPPYPCPYCSSSLLVCMFLAFSELFNVSYPILSSSIILSEMWDKYHFPILHEEDELQLDKGVISPEKNRIKNE